jgi:hypothetical protein
MTPTGIRSIGSRRIGAVLLIVALVGSLFVPATALAAGPSVTVTAAAGQANPTNGSPINFTVVFSDLVHGFTAGDVVIGGSAGGTKTVTVTGGNKIFNVAVTGMTTYGYVTVSVPAGVAFNVLAEPNLAGTIGGYGVFWWPGPFVTVNQAAGQADPTNMSPINFTVVFGEPVVGFAAGDAIIEGSAGGTKTATVTGGPATYNVAVTGMTTGGVVRMRLLAGAASNQAGQPNLPSTNTSTDDAVTWAPDWPTVMINQWASQTDPTSVSPINFTVLFSAPVTGFTAGDVTIGGTAGGTKTATVTGGPAVYNVAVSGMTTAGTVSATVPASAAQDASTRPNFASTSTDNSVTWTPVAGAITLTTSAPIPPGAKDPVILWGQGFTLGVQFGENGANRTFELQGTRDGAAWTTITTLTSDASGRAALVYRPVTNLFYRAVFAGAPDLAAATSNQVRTVVRGLAVMRPTNGGSTRSISRNASITFTTTVRPARPELPPSTVSFFFYHQVAGVWQLDTRRDIVVDGAGLARTTFIFSAAGQWYVRSQAGPTPYNANSVLTPVERYGVG